MVAKPPMQRTAVKTWQSISSMVAALIRNIMDLWGGDLVPFALAHLQSIWRKLRHILESTAVRRSFGSRLDHRMQHKAAADSVFVIQRFCL